MREDELRVLAGSLTKSERMALIPFVVFSEAARRKLLRLKLINDDGGVITHTPLGCEVARYLEKQRAVDTRRALSTLKETQNGR